MTQHDIELRPYGPTAGREHPKGPAKRPKTLTVDLHNHMRTPESDALVKPHLPQDFHPSVGVASDLTKQVNKKQSEDREIPLLFRLGYLSAFNLKREFSVFLLKI